MKPFQTDNLSTNTLRIIPGAGDGLMGKALLGDKTYRCALGKGGVCPAYLKREGDGKTPAGLYAPRWLYVRRDRLTNVTCPLPQKPIGKNDGWCDDPGSPNYNRPVSLPFANSHEALWRDDNLYDLVLVISHNDAPVVSNLGSAIFFHLALSDFSPTDGCVAFGKKDFLEILKKISPATLVRIHTNYV